MSHLRRVEIEAADSPSVDSFHRFRVSNPVSLFDCQFQYDTMPLLWEDITTTGGTVVHLPNESSVRLRISTASNASVIRQTRAYHRYQPGRSQLINCTFVMGATNTNVKKRVGYFDAEDGIYFEQQDDGALVITLRSKVSGSVVDTEVAQASWNLDPLDGSGPSTVTIDAEKANHLVIDLQWLGVGRVRVGFDIGPAGAPKIVYAHEFIGQNAATSAYMTTPNLPLRYEMVATGAAGAQTDLIQICASVISEGGFIEERAFPFSAGNGISSISVTSRRPIFSIQPAGTFNSITNRGRIQLETLDINAATQACYFEIVYNGTLTSPSFGAVDSSSIVEKDVAASAISGGIVLFSGTVGAAGAREEKVIDLLSKLPLVLDSAGSNPIVLSVVATAFTGTSSVSAQLTWREMR